MIRKLTLSLVGLLMLMGCGKDTTNDRVTARLVIQNMGNEGFHEVAEMSAKVIIASREGLDSLNYVKVDDALSIKDIICPCSIAFRPQYKIRDQIDSNSTYEVKLAFESTISTTLGGKIIDTDTSRRSSTFNGISISYIEQYIPRINSQIPQYLFYVNAEGMIEKLN